MQEILVTKFIEAWNHEDNSIRYSLLQQCFAQDGSFVDEQVQTQIKNLNELDFYIKASRSENKSKLVLRKEPEIHHNVFRISWQLENGSKTSGVFVGEIEDNEIKRIIGFND